MKIQNSKITKPNLPKRDLSMSLRIEIMLALTPTLSPEEREKSWRIGRFMDSTRQFPPREILSPKEGEGEERAIRRFRSSLSTRPTALRLALAAEHFGVGLGLGLFWSGGGIFHRAEITVLAALNEAFCDRFQFFPTAADVGGLFAGDLVVGNGFGDHGEQVGEFLDDFVGGGDEEFRMRVIGLGVLDEETAGTLADPLDETGIAGDAVERFDAVERVDGATAGGRVGRFSPFVDHGEGQAQLGSDGFGAAFLKHFPQQFMRLHGERHRGKRGGKQRRKDGEMPHQMVTVRLKAAASGRSMVAGAPGDFGLQTRRRIVNEFGCGGEYKCGVKWESELNALAEWRGFDKKIAQINPGR